LQKTTFSAQNTPQKEDIVKTLISLSLTYKSKLLIMKRFFGLMLTASILFSACKSTPKNAVTINSEDGKEKVSVDLNQAQNMATEMQKKTEELKALPPVTLDQLKALIPETLAGGKRKSYSANSAMGAAMAEASYQVNDSTDIDIVIYDCAGEAGAGLYSMQYLGMFNMQSENETEYTKTIDFNGGKGIESCQKDGSHCELTYVSGGRFLVMLKGHHLGADALKTIGGHLDIK
jgi:hypothetical protein